MGAEYPASCGICGCALSDEESTRTHVGACFAAHEDWCHVVIGCSTVGHCTCDVEIGRASSN